MKIILAGGGSGGPVMPLLATAQEIKKLEPNTQFLYIGTRKGPENAMVTQAGITFQSIVSAKWRRYLSLSNLFAPIVFLFGFFQSLNIVRKFRPDLVLSAGGVGAVEISYAAKVYGARIIIHQQDARVGLTNRLISPIANTITTAFEGTAKMFYSGSGLRPGKLEARAQWIGNPVRSDLSQSASNPKKYFQLHDQLPILLVLGGATGATQINKLIGEILPDLIKSYQVIHQTGMGKNNIQFQDENYHPYELIAFPEYAAALNISDLVIARAGLSTIAELSALGKTAIIIPMPGTHQEENAEVLRHLAAAITLTGASARATNLLKLLNRIKFDPDLTKALGQNIRQLMPPNAAARLAQISIHHGRR